MSPLVSIIIPCFNAARWLPATLESALAQTYAAREIIVIDDGSTDNSRTVAESYADRGVRVVTQTNAGQGAACNHGLRLARGEYVKFFDADDLLSPDMLVRQVTALGNHPGSLAYSEWARFHADPAEATFVPRPGWHDAAPVDWLVEILADAQPMMQCAQFLVPRALLERTGGWDERLTVFNDLEFFTRLTVASAGIAFTPKARLYYRSGLAGSASQSRTARSWNSTFLAANLTTEHLLQAENSARTRRVAANVLQGLIYDMYPNMPGLVTQLESRIAELGGSRLAPLGGRSFHFVRRLAGWKAARRLQRWAGKYPAKLVR